MQTWIGYGCASSRSPFHHHLFFCKHVCELSTHAGELQVRERGLAMVVLPFHHLSVLLQTTYVKLTTYTHTL
jgi:hypothetical protein